MILDPTWLSVEAEKIHVILLDTALGIAGIFLYLIRIICDYFRLSFFSFVPVASDLVSRLFIAFLLLYFYEDIADALSNFTDALVGKIGKLNDIEHVLSRMGEKLHDLSWNWTSIKDTTILALCFATFLLYISVFIMNAGVIYVWLLLYLLSPILIILNLTPATEGATKVLFRSLIEVCCWKIMWGISAALLWSSALGSMNSTEELNFLTVISFNLILALSLLATPILVNIVASSGLALLASQSVSNLTNAATNNLPRMAKSAANAGSSAKANINPTEPKERS